MSGTNEDVTPIIGGDLELLPSAVEDDIAAFEDFANEMLGIEEVKEEVEKDAEDQPEDVEEEDPDTEADDSEQEESDEEDEAGGSDSEETSSDEDVFVVELNGEEFEVTEQELLKGYSRSSEHKEQMASLASEKESLIAEKAELVEQSQKYGALVQANLDKQLGILKEYDEVDWDNLRYNDPQQFLMLKAEMEDVRTQINSDIETKKELMKDATVKAEVVDVNLDAERNRLATFNITTENSVLMEQSEKEGFTDTDNSLLKHALVIKLLEKANKYDLLQKSKEQAETKLTKKVPKIASKKLGQPPKGKTSHDISEQMDKCKASGDLHDATFMFEEFVN